MSRAISFILARDLTYSGESVRPTRSEEHTSELQSQSNLVCRLLLEKKKRSFTYRHDSQDHGTTQCFLFSIRYTEPALPKPINLSAEKERFVHSAALHRAEESPDPV